MSYYKVVYDKLFPYAPYLNERIGIEILIEKGQDPMEVFEDARQKVHDFRNKHIQAELSHQYEPATEKIPDIQLEKEENQSLEQHIMGCTEFKVLESYYLIVKNNPHLQNVYDIKRKQLVAKESQEIIDKTNALLPKNAKLKQLKKLKP